ncbi:MAG TPA: Na+/H+ antiporter subunit E [Lacipirellulaceae bacterium]|nr:Na+/H+ antiporter subunit E [Lacipirellulaceae bacterium]HMP06683.1 Na+/H+ antiporter subunit E [Lacipirellulaceae bacterium]
MNLFLWNLLLAITWAVATGEFTLPNLAIGFGAGYLTLVIARRALGDSTYYRKAPLTVRFFFFYMKQMVMANLRVAYDVVTPTHYMRPGVIAVPLDVKTDAEITLLANLITLTPGTLSLDLSADRRTLYVHTMYIDDDEDRTRQQIKDGLERRVLELLR